MSRTFGWVQDPGKFENLKRTVDVFNHESDLHSELINTIIPNLIERRDGRDKLLLAMNNRPLTLNYADLTGTAFVPRASARCNGIIQAAIPGQRRPYISDWPADNFLRWAQALGFISFIDNTDSFKITPFGLEYSNSAAGSEEEKNVLEIALLSYPPVVRILSLLSSGDHLTKFEMGRNLGFVGEDGFTSIAQNLVVQAIALETSSLEKNKIRTDMEGSADKYARMIATWLQKIGWVRASSKECIEVVGDRTYTEKINQAYSITTSGQRALRRAYGSSGYARVPKIVSWEMLSTKGLDKDYIRTRRAYIIQFLLTGKKTISDLSTKLKNLLFDDSDATILDDIEGLKNIGLNIRESSRYFILSEDIQGLKIPIVTTTKSDVLVAKEACRQKLINIPHSYLSLIDLSYDGSQNRQFEMETIALLVNECGFNGTHLGGTRKPDGIIYYDTNGLIIDNKSYSSGYPIPIGQADEMVRYLTDNINRDEIINPNKWWENFPETVTDFNFAFVSSKFTGMFESQLNNIANRAVITGAAITAINLLLMAEAIKANNISHIQALQLFTTNKEIIL